MGNKYLVSRDNVTPTGGNDLITIVTASNRRARILEVAVNGRGSTSAPLEVIVGTSSGGTTGGGGITPDKFEHVDQPAAASTVNTTWSVQPTIATNVVKLGFNALGGANRWIPPGGKGIEARNGANISIRATNGPTWQAMSVSIVYEED
jgi:hypothetical protein